MAITPTDIANKALDYLHHYRSKDTFALNYINIHNSDDLGPQKLGNTVHVQGGTHPVALEYVYDVSFKVEDGDFELSTEDFDRQFISPVAEAIADGINRKLLSLRGFGPYDIQTHRAERGAFTGLDESIVLVSAPLEDSPFTDSVVVSRDGLSVRVVFDEPEDGRRVVHVDVLYGVVDTDAVAVSA